MQIIKKIVLCISLSAIGVYFFNLFKKSPSTSSNKEKLIIGTAAGYAPFVSINAQGTYEGFDIDVAKALANELNYELEIKDLGSMSSLFIALEQGSIDAIIWALSITQERLKKVAMIRYQGEDTTSFPLIFWETIPNNAQTIQELNNATICAESGSCQEAVLDKYTNVQKVTINHVDDALLNIQYKKADGAIVEPAIAKKFQKQFPQIKTLDLPLSPEEQIQGIGIAIKKNNQQLIDTIEKSIQNLERQGIISQLEKKWGLAS